MEIILAFGLGIMLVCAVVLINMVVHSNKKVEKLESKLESVNNNLLDVIRVINNNNDALYKQIDSVDKKHIEQVTKIYSELNQKVEFLRRNLAKEY